MLSALSPLRIEVPPSEAPPLPPPRGPRSEALFAAFLSAEPAAEFPSFDEPNDPLVDEDLHLSLYACYELHYRGFAQVAAEKEWDPAVLAFRSRTLEAPFERALRADAGEAPGEATSARDVIDILLSLSAPDAKPSISRYLAREADVEAFTEFIIHRSLYTLKEADPHSFVIARLEGPAKAALMEIQSDEYGGGRPDRMHATLFARTMRQLGLDDRYGEYLHAVPGSTLATVNLVSMLSLHRRLAAAAMGHLALFELTSSVASRRYGNGLRRLGFGAAATDYFDEHVEADAVHDMIATHDVAAQMVRQDPSVASDVVFGARALDLVERRLADELLVAWRDGRSSLRTPLTVA